MEGLPFSDAEWDGVKEAALGCVNATFADDVVLRAAHFEQLRTRLAYLRARYGEHPLLLETEADFADDPRERRELYERAVRSAEAEGYVTYSIRISFARLLLDEFDAPARALAELTACEPELPTRADESEKREWAELAARCRSG